MYVGVTLPSLLWLGAQHVQGDLYLGDGVEVHVSYNTDATQPQNTWWNALRATYSKLRDNVIYGDIVFSRQGEDLHWSKDTFMAVVARGLALAELQ